MNIVREVGVWVRVPSERRDGSWSVGEGAE